MSRNRTIIASLLLSTFSCACPDGETRQPDPHIEDSFSLGGPFVGAHHGHVTLQRHALGKAFLVLPTVIYSTPIPMPNLMAPKVVSFELQGSKLAMLERNLEAVYSELPSVKLLQTFEITDQTDDTVTFNWHMGLESVPQERSFTISAAADEGEGDDSALLQAPEPQRPRQVHSSFLRSAKIVANGLELEQVSRLEPDAAKPTAPDKLTLRTRIVPYMLSEAFQPRASVLTQGIGYFAVAHGQRTMRWDASAARGPVTYRLSQHTPPQFVQAITEGILYWNRVAGRELVRVELNADPDGPMGDRQVMVHWINWANAPIAYGETQADPITGELLQGAIYLPSSWTQAGARAMDGLAIATPHAGVAPQGFSAAALCNHTRQGHSSQFYSRLESQPAASERATLDALRGVVAHEVGHTLGLRHNFAASGQSSLADAASLRAELAAYAAQPQHPGAVAASSVMDYLTDDEMVLQGAAILHQALPYDVAAVQWGYGRVPVQVSDLAKLPFCTDGEADKRVLGCDRNDSGARPLASYVHALKDERTHFGARLARAVLHDSERAAQGARLSASLEVTSRNAINKLFNHLTQGASVLEVRRAMGPQQRLMNPRAYAQAMEAALGRAAGEVEGLPGMLAAAYPIDAQHAPVTGWLLTDLVEALQRGGVPRTAIGSLRQALAPSTEALEQAFLTSALEGFTGGAPGALKAAAAEASGPTVTLKPASFAAGVVQPGWESVLAETGRHVIFDTKSAGDLPQARFSQAARMAAVRLFSGELFGVQGWAQAQRTQLITDLNQRREVEALRPVMGTAIKGAAERTQWLREELDLINALNALTQ